MQDLYASATHDDKSGETILKVVNPQGAAQPVDIKLAGLSEIQPDGRAFVVSGDSPDEVNPIGTAKKISPVESEFSNAAADFSYTFPPLSVTVLRIHGQ